MPIETKVGNCLTQTVCDDFDEKKKQYKWFIQMSQWSQHAFRSNKELPENLIPYTYLGFKDIETARVLFGVSTDMKQIEWLGEIIDSTD